MFIEQRLVTLPHEKIQTCIGKTEMQFFENARCKNYIADKSSLYNKDLFQNRQD